MKIQIQFRKQECKCYPVTSQTKDEKKLKRKVSEMIEESKWGTSCKYM